MSIKAPLFLLLFVLVSHTLPAQEVPADLLTGFEQDRNTTATYWQAIAYYEKLVSQFPQQCHLLEINPPGGGTDAGLPLHAVVLSADGLFTPTAARAAGKNVLLVNNAIHPGEPCGVDASMMLVRDYLLQPPPELAATVLVIIPVYNVGGALNRNSTTRANQNGPKEYGFRGNARHLDLNRDFIKADSRNARSFTQLFQYWNPDVFIDNHTSNGSDHQYTFTLIPTQHDKLAPPLADYLQQRMLPYLNTGMATRNWEVIPYVYARTTPDEGIAGFLDLPRYSTGYAALHHTIGFMPETHMLKPYADRVQSVYAFMRTTVALLAEDGKRIQQLRAQAVQEARTAATFPIDWDIDFTRVDSLTFKGYTARYKPSEISGQDRLYYDQSSPFSKRIPHYNNYRATRSVTRPTAYILPQAYSEVADHLRMNGVVLRPFPTDTTLAVMQYQISDFKSRDMPYEGHYLHTDVTLDTLRRSWTYRAGDYWIDTDQPAVRFLIETLEPQAPDSYFAWNFFDGILMQKEYFSPYIFEDMAARYLAEDPALRTALEERKAADATFAKSAYQQLEFIYERSPHREPGYQLYPVARVE